MTLEWFGGELIARENAYTREALKTAAEMVLAKAVEQTPEETGALRRSATVNEQNGGKTQELSFNTPYAHRQHEDLSYNHPVGNAKYLETPLRENADKVLAYLNKATARAMGG
jgi:hypothetical protein